MNILNIVKLEEKAVSPHRKNGEGTGISSRTNNLQKRARISEYMFAVTMKFKRIKRGFAKWKHSTTIKHNFRDPNFKHVHRTK